VLFPSLPLRGRVLALRRDLRAADGLFGALADALGKQLVTKEPAP
jgi:predicted nucleic acid-binding protein